MKNHHRHSRRKTICLLGAGLLLGACQTNAAGMSGTRPSPGRGAPVDPQTPVRSPDDPQTPMPSPDDPQTPVSSPGPGPGHPRPRRPVPSGPGPGLHGVLRDHAGRPVGHVMIQAEALGDSPGVPEMGVFADAQGRFHWPLRPGRYRLTAASEGRHARAIVTVPPSGHAHRDLILR